MGATTLQNVFRLADLPREVRDNVFTHLLLGQQDMYPYQYGEMNKTRCSCHKETAPELAITLVNKMMSAEATEILYSKAIFHMTAGPMFIHFFGDVHRFSDDGWRHPMLHVEDRFLSRHQIKKLTIKFTPLHTPVCQIKHLWADHDFEELDEDERKEYLHDLASSAQIHAWSHMFDITIGLQGIKHLIVDIEDLMCAHGCCRLATEADEVFGAIKGTNGFRIAVVGQLCHGENAMVAAALEKIGHTAFYDARDGYNIPHEDDSSSEDDHEDEDDEDDESNSDDGGSDESDEDDIGESDDDKADKKIDVK